MGFIAVKHSTMASFTDTGSSLSKSGVLNRGNFAPGGILSKFNWEFHCGG